MPLYYVETEMGCGIRDAKDIRQARKELRDEIGQLGKVVRKAEKEDVEWVRAMGGSWHCDPARTLETIQSKPA